MIVAIVKRSQREAGEFWESVEVDVKSEMPDGTLVIAPKGDSDLVGCVFPVKGELVFEVDRIEETWDQLGKMNQVVSV